MVYELILHCMLRAVLLPGVCLQVPPHFTSGCDLLLCGKAQS